MQFEFHMQNYYLNQGFARCYDPPILISAPEYKLIILQIMHISNQGIFAKSANFLQNIQIEIWHSVSLYTGFSPQKPTVLIVVHCVISTLLPYDWAVFSPQTLK